MENAECEWETPSVNGERLVRTENAWREWGTLSENGERLVLMRTLSPNGKQLVLMENAWWECGTLSPNGEGVILMENAECEWETLGITNETNAMSIVDTSILNDVANLSS